MDNKNKTQQKHTKLYKAKPSHFRTSSRELEGTTGTDARNLDEEHSR